MNRKILLKAGALILALFLIAALLFLTNAFTGNPISLSLARSKAAKYISEEYPQSDFTISDVSYVFKDSSYHVDVKSEKSPDTYFTISVRGGKIRYDSFDFQVTSGMNTADRLREEYKEQTEDLIKTKLSGVSKIYVLPVLPSDDEEEETQCKFPLDSKFNKAEFVDVRYRVCLNGGGTQLQNLAKTLSDIEAALTGGGYGFSAIELIVEGVDKPVSISGVTKEHVQSGSLETILQKAMADESGSYDGVSVYSKS